MSTEGSGPVVVTMNDQDDAVVDMSAWESLARQVLHDEGIGPEAELNLTFINIDEMTSLNETHMDKVGPTDVLSFPLEDDPLDSDIALVDGQPRLLGDVVICPKVVHAQAPESPVDEMALMVVHGVLHILGMDHQEVDEAAEMQAAEQRHLSRWRGESSVS